METHERKQFNLQHNHYSTQHRMSKIMVFRSDSVAKMAQNSTYLGRTTKLKCPEIRKLLKNPAQFRCRKNFLP